jgi:hypothetical protein
MKSIFLSIPVELNKEQQTFYDDFCQYLIHSKSIYPKTLGKNIYTQDAIYSSIRKIFIEDCVGCIIVGFKKGEGIEVSAWNQLEAGIAIALDMPIYRLIEKDIYRNGIFDRQNGLGPCEEIDLSKSQSWLLEPSFQQTFDQWQDKVSKYVAMKPRIVDFFDQLYSNTIH